MGRPLRLVWRSGPRWTVASLLLTVAQGVLPLVALYAMKLVVDAVAAGLEAGGQAVAFTRIALLIGLVGLVALLSAGFRSLSGLVSEAQAQFVTDRIHDILHAKSTDVDLEYYENSQYHDTLHRAQQEAPYRPTRIMENLLRVAQNGISVLAIIALLFSLHPAVALVVFAAAVPGVLVRVRYADQLHRWQRKPTRTERQAEYFNSMLTGDGHAKEIRLFTLGPLFIQRFRDLRRQLRRERLRIATRRSIAELVTQTGTTIALFGAYVFIAYRAVQGSISLGDLVMYF